ncbi:sortase [Actinophytocola sediminis]
MVDTPVREESAEHPPVEPVAPVREASFRARLANRVLALLAVGALGFAGYLVLLSPIEQDANQDVLYSRLRGPIAEGVPPYTGAEVSADGQSERAVPAIYDDGEDVLIPAGAPIAVLDVPGIGLRQVVVEGTSSGDLMSGPGHRRDTPLPGQQGVSLLYGRSATFGGPFRDISRLRPGDELTVVTFQGEFTYEVEGVRRDGDPLPDLSAVVDGGSRLTMVTAEGANPFQPDHTVFVDALMTGDSQPAAQRPALIPPEERSLASDRPALLNLVLWMQALAVLAVAMAWLRVRWGRWETHLVGLPAVLAVLWHVYESVARLLPNLA